MTTFRNYFAAILVVGTFVFSTTATAQHAAIADVALAQATNPNAGVDKVVPLQEYKAAQGITTKNIDEIVYVRGKVAEFRSAWSSRAPNIIYIRDGEHEIEIVFWTNGEDVPENLPDFSQPNTPVFAQGQVETYNGRLQVKVSNLSRISTKPLLQLKEDESAVSNNRRRDGIRWDTYSPLRAQGAMTEQGHVVIYVRNNNVPRCREFEQAYLLTDEAAKYMGAQTIFFIDVSTQTGAAMARNLQVYRVPTIVVYTKGRELERKALTFTDVTEPTEVRNFFVGIPR